MSYACLLLGWVVGWLFWLVVCWQSPVFGCRFEKMEGAEKRDQGKGQVGEKINAIKADRGQNSEKGWEFLMQRLCYVKM